jgi:RimJ/RimL family protein N-acetyltransferase
VAETPFVPPEFVAPLALETEQFRLEPLGPQHNEPDYAAWSSSIEHIRQTPGWEKSSWPDDRDLAKNLADLEGHAADFEQRKGFTYTVLDLATGDVIGCVYIYPDKSGEHDAKVLSWVTESRAELDEPLWQAVSEWIEADWPFETTAYAARG